MPVPTRIEIKREEGYHTHYIGKYGNNNQFMGFVVSTLPDSHQSPIPDDWQHQKRWYAVLYKFDADGNHIDTEAWFAGVSAEGENTVTQRAARKLNEMIAGLGTHRFGDVRIRLFSTRVDGREFGLVKAWNDEAGIEEVHLLPHDLFFCDPWDGTYDT